MIAGGGIAGSSLFRYLSEAGYKLTLSITDLEVLGEISPADDLHSHYRLLPIIAMHNLEIFKALNEKSRIDFKLTRYINLAHDEETYKSLDLSRAWSDAYMVDKKDFRKEISPYFNTSLSTYSHALITNNCWQANPGLTIDAVRHIGQSLGGTILENTKLIDVSRDGKEYCVILQTPDREYLEFRTEIL